MTDRDFLKVLPGVLFIIIILMAITAGVGLGLLQLVHWVLP